MTLHLQFTSTILLIDKSQQNRDLSTIYEKWMKYYHKSGPPDMNLSPLLFSPTLYLVPLCRGSPVMGVCAQTTDGSPLWLES